MSELTARMLHANRRRLCLTQPQAAAAIGANIHTYQAWEMDKTRGVRHRYWVRLHALAPDAAAQAVRSHYRGWSTAQIAADWCARLSPGAPLGFADLARYLHVHPVTAWSWLSDRRHLSPARLAEYERRVQDIEDDDWVRARCWERDGMDPLS